MYWEINVSLHGRHFFATSKRSLTDERKMCDVYDELARAFTEEAGYKLSVSKRQETGEVVVIKKCIGDRIRVKESKGLGTPSAMATIRALYEKGYIVHIDGDHDEWEGPITWDGDVVEDWHTPL